MALRVGGKLAAAARAAALHLCRSQPYQ